MSSAPADAGRVAPPLDDPVANAAADGFGGVTGRRISVAGMRGVARVLVILTLITFGLGIAMRAPCYNTAWTGGGNQQYTHLCYSDIPHMFRLRGFAAHQMPYFKNKSLEYPVVVGMAMEAASWFAHHFGGTGNVNNDARWFYNVTSWGLLLFAVITVLALIGTSGKRRPWDAALFALAPMLLLAGTINWDIVAAGLVAVGLFLWSRQRAFPAGILLGLGAAAKFYPVLLFLPLLVLCFRAGRMRAWSVAFLGGALAWLAVNLPFILGAEKGWRYFYTFNRLRDADYGSVWLALRDGVSISFSVGTLNILVIALLGIGLLAVGLLGLLARERPRVGQLAFLSVAVFVLVNKSYSPQYVLWLVPLAVMARPRWRDFLIWQACEVVYYGGIWLHLAYVYTPARGLPDGGYLLTLLVYLGGTIYFMVQVVRDVLDPTRDPVRVSGEEDPAGGVLVGSEDAYGWGPLPAEA